jgi:hypothetical protein
MIDLSLVMFRKSENGAKARSLPDAAVGMRQDPFGFPARSARECICYAPFAASFQHRYGGGLVVGSNGDRF